MQTTMQTTKEYNGRNYTVECSAKNVMIDENARRNGDLFPLALCSYPVVDNDQWLVNNETHENSYVMGLFATEIEATNFMKNYLQYHGIG